MSVQIWRRNLNIKMICTDKIETQYAMVCLWWEEERRERGLDEDGGDGEVLPKHIEEEVSGRRRRVLIVRKLLPRS